MIWYIFRLSKKGRNYHLHLPPPMFANIIKLDPFMQLPSLLLLCSSSIFRNLISLLILNNILLCHFWFTIVFHYIRYHSFRFCVDDDSFSFMNTNAFSQPLTTKKHTKFIYLSSFACGEFFSPSLFLWNWKTNRYLIQTHCKSTYITHPVIYCEALLIFT